MEWAQPVKTYIQIKSSIPFWGASQVVLVVKNPPANAGDIRDAGLIPGSGRSPGGGRGSPLQCSCLENPMDRGAWWATVHWVIKNWTWLKQLSTHAHTVFLYSTSRSHAQSRNSDMNVESKHMNVKRERGDWMNREMGLTYIHYDGIDIYTLLILCIKWIINENLLCSSRNSTQRSVVTWMERKSKKEGIHAYV